jgi:CsoR family transcriptional regulator, copper-sensing transcriptional repressor
MTRKAVKVDHDGKHENLVRLKRIEGQVRGLQKMIEEERYCVDVLAQIAAVEAALQAVSKELVRNHLRHCATKAFKTGEPDADQVIDELVEVISKRR